jgi:hypothetical protein
MDRTERTHRRSSWLLALAPRRPGRRRRPAQARPQLLGHDLDDGPGAGPGRRLRRAAHRGAGRAASASGGPAAGALDVAEIVVEVRGELYMGAAQDPGRPAHRDPAQSGGRGVGRAPGAGRRGGCLGVHRRQGRGTAASNFRVKVWLPAIRSVGLVPLRPHDLRLTAVALWIAAGANPKEVSVRAGHTSVAFTLDRYGHLFPGHDDEPPDRLDAMHAQGLRAVPDGAVVELPGGPGRPGAAPRGPRQSKQLRRPGGIPGLG